MKKKLWILFFYLMCIFLTVSLINNYNQYQEIKRYETYVNNRIDHLVVQITKSLNSNEKLLEDIFRSGSIEAVNIEQLSENFLDISKKVYELYGMAESTGKIDYSSRDSSKVINYTSSIAQNISLYVRNGLINDKLITPKNKGNLIKIQSVNEKWKSIMEQSYDDNPFKALEHLSYYAKNDLNYISSVDFFTQ